MTIEAKDIHDFAKAFSEAVGSKSELVDIVKALAWPFVAGVALIGFHKPLSRLVQDLGRRVTKFSAFHVEVELATITSPSISLSDFDFHGENPAGEASPSTVAELVTKVEKNAPPSDLIVDIGGGRRWLFSRLFLFSYLLQRTGAIRSIAFVQSTDKRQRQFLGIAKPEAIYGTLGKKYAWFNTALAESLTTPALDYSAPKDIRVLAEPLPKEVGQQMVYNFMANPLIRLQNAPPTPDEWEKLTTGPWEHSKWIDRRRFNGDLLPVLLDSDASRVVISPDTSNSARNKALLRRPVAFIALVNDRGELRGVVDRSAFLDRLAMHVVAAGEPADSATSTNPVCVHDTDEED